MKVLDKIKKCKPDHIISFAFGNENIEGGVYVRCLARNIKIDNDKLKLLSSNFDMFEFGISISIDPEAEVVEDECYMEFDHNFISILF